MLQADFRYCKHTITSTKHTCHSPDIVLLAGSKYSKHTVTDRRLVLQTNYHIHTSLSKHSVTDRLLILQTRDLIHETHLPFVNLCYTQATDTPNTPSHTHSNLNTPRQTPNTLFKQCHRQAPNTQNTPSRIDAWYSKQMVIHQTHCHR